MKKFSLLTLGAFSLFAYPMFAADTEETKEEPVSVETVSTEVSLNEDDAQDNLMSYSSKSEEQDSASA